MPSRTFSRSPGSVSSSLKALATSLGIKRPGGKSSHNQEYDEGTANSKTRDPASFSPGKLFSGKARDSLVEHATPYSQLPPAESLPDTDHFKFSTPDASILGLDGDDEDGPVPGSSSRSGKPAPLGARLSMGVGQSTIRLVTQPSAPRFEDAYMSPPRLPTIQPDFDIKMGTPSAGRVLSVWPASPRTHGVGDEDEGRLYPKLPLEDLEAARGRSGSDVVGDSDAEDVPMPGDIFASATTPARSARSRTTTATTVTTATPRPAATRGPVDEPDMFSPSKPSAASAIAAGSQDGGDRPAPPRNNLFLFGSPLPRRETPKASSSLNDDAAVGVSNVAFEGAAKSVLEEMHRRLAEAQKEREKNGEVKPTSSTADAGANIFSGLTFGAGPAANGAGANDRYAKVHETEFAKMDSIANHYAARRPTANNRKRKSDALGLGAAGARAGQKRRSSAAGTRVISNGVRKKMAVPGGFGGDDDASDREAEDADQTTQGREDAEDEEEDVGARRSSKRMRITEGWDVHRGQRVSLAPPLSPAAEEKKQKERDAIKRDLEVAKARRRSSRGRPSMGGKAAPPAKGKTSRFGFLSSAKSIVRNVWNMGAGGKTKAATTVNAPPSNIPIAKPATASSAAAPAKIDDAQKIGKGAAPKAVPVPAPQNARKASGAHSRIPSVSSTSSKLLKPSASATDGHPSGTIASTKSSNSRARSPIPSFSQAPATKATTSTSRPSSVVGNARSRVSSIAGTAASRQSSRTSAVSSMGTRSSAMTGASSTAVSSIGTRRSMASTNTLASTSSRADVGSKTTGDGKEHTARKRTSSLLAPTASSLAKTNSAVKPSTSGRPSGLSSLPENQKRASAMPGPSKIPAGSRIPSISPPPSRIFSQPLTNFGSPASNASPAQLPSLGAAATALFANADDSSPSKIPRPAVIPPKPKALVARKPRISRSRVIAKLGAQRAAAAQGPPTSPNTRTRSSFGARRSFGGVKSGRASGGPEIMRNAAKKRARQSEYMRRKSRVGAGENEGPAGDDDD
ncbi:hypothetical protein C8Q73DRAFT_46900 [Cubamyces lactineus]|nr:hypothetical protein C8Q73DRAFT_46900 [Cubamyces lactineus]